MTVTTLLFHATQLTYIWHRWSLSLRAKVPNNTINISALLLFHMTLTFSAKRPSFIKYPIFKMYNFCMPVIQVWESLLPLIRFFPWFSLDTLRKNVIKWARMLMDGPALSLFWAIQIPFICLLDFASLTFARNIKKSNSLRPIRGILFAYSRLLRNDVPVFILLLLSMMLFPVCHFISIATEYLPLLLFVSWFWCLYWNQGLSKSFLFPFSSLLYLIFWESRFS